LLIVHLWRRIAIRLSVFLLFPTKIVFFLLFVCIFYLNMSMNFIML